jgi:hypothetical protein
MSDFLKKMEARLASVKASVGSRLVSPEEKERRLDICNACEFFFNPTKQCRQCGCIMPAKAMLTKSTCPINKWPVINIKQV